MCTCMSWARAVGGGGGVGLGDWEYFQNTVKVFTIVNGTNHPHSERKQGEGWKGGIETVEALLAF